MSRSKLNPILSLDELRREVDRLFESCLGTTPSELIRGRKAPAVDIWEQDDLLLVQAEVPGVTMDQIEVYALGQQLTIKGHRDPASAGGTCLHRQELPAGDFQRTLTLPFEIDPEQVEAKLENGLLTLTIPKPKVIATRRIPVKSPSATPGHP